MLTPWNKIEVFSAPKTGNIVLVLATFKFMSLGWIYVYRLGTMLGEKHENYCALLLISMLLLLMQIKEKQTCFSLSRATTESWYFHLFNNDRTETIYSRGLHLFCKHTIHKYLCKGIKKYRHPSIDCTNFDKNLLPVVHCICNVYFVIYCWNALFPVFPYVVPSGG